MTFLTSPGKTYSIYSVAGCTVSVDGTVVVTVEPGKQIAFVAPDEEIVVSDADAIIVEVTGIGADLTVAEAGSGGPIDLTGVALLDGGNTFTGDQVIEGDVTVSGEVTTSDEFLREAQIYLPATIPSVMVSGRVYDLGVINSNQDLSAITFKAAPGYVQTCEIWMETGDTGYSVTWPEGSVWPDEPNGVAPSFVLSVNKRYRFAVRNEGNGTIVITKAYEYSV